MISLELLDIILNSKAYTEEIIVLPHDGNDSGVTNRQMFGIDNDDYTEAGVYIYKTDEYTLMDSVHKLDEDGIWRHIGIVINK